MAHRIWQVFRETAVHCRSAGEVAETLSMSLGAVYTAKSRVIARLRDLIEEATGEECPMDHRNQVNGPALAPGKAR